MPDHPEGAVPTGDVFARLRRAGPVVVVLDALDEAEDPAAVLRDLLLPLSGTGPTDPVPGCRVLIGTRPWWDAFPDLRNVTENRPDMLEDLDTQSPGELAQDLAEYLGDLLYPHYAQTTADAIADRLARTSEHGAFLVAALYADHLLTQAATGRPVPDESIVSEMPTTITQMFDLHATSLTRKNPWVGPVLDVLGRARGQGIPLEILHTVALAHAAEFGNRPLPPTLEDTREALTHAYFYLRTATAADPEQRTLYRYFHQALTDHTARRADPACQRSRNSPRSP
ncbi:hypothetical protein ABZT03_31290 [Streptomyces sp. NPDC005574]|uniref:hypothetical protein n=1 Tax=Streptomyces sp. NPDC005574 TaxID=3156891 RepID=UPI0033A0D955